MAGRRENAQVKQDSIGELQEQVRLASDNKGSIDHKVTYLKRRIYRLCLQVNKARRDFLTFCKARVLDDHYIVFQQVAGDEIYPDTAPGQGLTQVKVEDAMIPNVSDEQMLRLRYTIRDKFYTLEKDVDEYLDYIYKIKSNKAVLEGYLLGALQAQKDYAKELEFKRDVYVVLRKNMEDVKLLQKYLLEFKTIFDVIPEVLTSETASKFHTNYIDKYSTFYVSKKGNIVRGSLKLMDSFGDTTSEGDTSVNYFIDIFEQINGYFNSLPDHYTEAIANKSDIINSVTTYYGKLQEAANRLLVSLDTLRGYAARGVGNAVLDNAITNTIEMANNPNNSRRIDQTTLDQIIEQNDISLKRVKKEIDEFKNVIGNGIDKITDNVALTIRTKLERMSVNTKPGKFLKTNDIYKEDCVREKVRRRYGGNIPFCDEIVTTDAQGATSFVKKSEWDEKAGKKKVDVQVEAAYKKGNPPRNILN